MVDEENQVILIIDDQVELVETYKGSLEDNYSVRVATDGPEGLAKFDADVDVVLLDRKMPGMSGEEVLTQLRASDVNCRVVMVTAVEPDLDLLSMNFDEYLVKPVSGTDLRNVVKRMLARNALEEHLQATFAVSTKLATIEEKLSADQLAQSQEYHDLLDEFESRRSGDVIQEAMTEGFSAATLEKLELLLDKGH